MIGLCLLLQLCVLVASQRTELDSPDNLYIFRTVRKWLQQNFGATNNARQFSTEFGRQVQDEVPPDVPFPCNVTGGRSSEVPDSVHRLRPGDIDVIAALGDSLTAGAGIFATNIFQVGIDNRGVSGTIGGQGNWRTFLTLPNILKEFNPNLIGYSLGDSTTADPASQLNVAEIGAMSRDMPFMAKYLVDRIKKDPRINIKKHWKLVSILIGSNDICLNVCETSASSFLEAHKMDIIKTLRILRDNLPRTLVSFNVQLNLETMVESIKKRRLFRCYFTTQIECPCLFGLKHEHKMLQYYDVIHRWQALEEEVVYYPEFNKKDFTVVASPTLKRFILPLAEDGLPDMTLFSADCFHASQKSNAWYANGAWNNLLEPVGNKTTFCYPPYERFLCPTPERPYLMTRENSRKISSRKVSLFSDRKVL